MTGTMSKALEAAHEAGVEAFKARFSADCSAVDALTDYRDAFLAHMAEDEAVVERMASAIMEVQGYEVLHQDTPDVDDQTIAAFEDAYDCAKEEARAALKSLAGKE